MYKTHGLYTMDLIKFNLFNDSSNWKRDFYTFKLIATLKKLERKKKMIKCMKVATMQSHWSHRGFTKSFLVFSGAVRFEYWPKGGYLLQNHCAKRNLLLCQVISATHAASYSILTLPLYFSFKTSINLSYYCHKQRTFCLGGSGFCTNHWSYHIAAQHFFPPMSDLFRFFIYWII